MRTSSGWLLPAAGVLFLLALLPGIALFVSGRMERDGVARLLAAVRRARPKRRSSR